MYSCYTCKAIIYWDEILATADMCVCVCVCGGGVWCVCVGGGGEGGIVSVW